ncbi:type II toxin-antitoxin system VapC family toxin [Demequina silvatica]|uniref:type II toxin-antitoxin system VapC family toxin n=1 Tax=Demequina silvatica TaxID=1638988 RepID=UPI0007829C20|nr:type II toxin-antitoxin system VapC family toxin [Demequina silvatica]
MIVLDTNVISEVFRPAPDAEVIGWLSALDGDVAITAVTLAELFAGIALLPAGARRDALAARVESALEPYRGGGSVLPFDGAAADEYATILAARSQAGLPISTADAQIAAICRAHRAACATRNVRDFAHTGIALIDPWERPTRPPRDDAVAG